MIKLFLASSIPVAFLLSGAIPCYVLLRAWRAVQRRYSPLSRNLVRPPGYSLSRQIEKIDDDIFSCVAGLSVTPLLCFAIHASASHYGHSQEMVSRTVGSVLAGLLIIGTVLTLLWRNMNFRRRLVAGLEAELATAQELNRLANDGCKVFHDVPFPYGNIDHVVIAPSGVFAINTKTRGKSRKGEQNSRVLVDHDRELLVFPDGSFPVPAGQLQREAKWLMEELSQATETNVVVEPMLALPGWFVESKEIAVRLSSSIHVIPRDYSVSGRSSSLLSAFSKSLIK
jgi:hypothetical protein